MSDFTRPSSFQLRIWHSGLTALAVAALILVLSGFGWVFYLALTFFKPILLPVAAGGVVAYIMEPVVELLEKRGQSRPVMVLTLFFLVFLSLVSIGLLVVPKLFHEIENLVVDMPGYYNSLTQYISPWTARIGVTLQENPEWFQQIHTHVQEQGGKWLESLSKWALRGVQGLPEMLTLGFGFLLTPLYAYYFLVERHKIEANWRDYIPLRKEWYRDEITHVLEQTNGYMIAFFRGQVFVAMIIGVLTAIGLSLIGLNFALLLGLLTGVLSLIPYLGIILSITPSVLIGIVQTASWQLPLLVILVFVAVQMFEGFFVTPKIMGDRVGLHPITIIISILVWGQILGGLMGAVLAIPLTATLRVLVFRYILPHKGTNVGNQPSTTSAPSSPPANPS